MTNIWGISTTQGTNVCVWMWNMDNPSHLFSSWPLPCSLGRSGMLSLILALSKPKVAALCSKLADDVETKMSVRFSQWTLSSAGSECCFSSTLEHDHLFH